MDDNYKQAVGVGMLITVLIAIFLIMLIFCMSGCANTQAVYQQDTGWKSMPKKSAVTGWKYIK